VDQLRASSSLGARTASTDDCASASASKVKCRVLGKAGRTQAGGRVIFEVCVMQGGMKRAAHARGRPAIAFRRKHGALFQCYVWAVVVRPHSAASRSQQAHAPCFMLIILANIFISVACSCLCRRLSASMACFTLRSGFTLLRCLIFLLAPHQLLRQRTLFSMLYIASFVITAVLPLHCRLSATAPRHPSFALLFLHVPALVRFQFMYFLE
jgi:hypothetical protein